MWALIPVKRYCQAKQRLSGFLMPGERINLFKAMLEDLLGVLCDHPDIESVLLVSDEPAVNKLAIDKGLELLTEKELGVNGLNNVVQAAVTKLMQRGIDDVMVVHGDLPLLNEQEISILIQSHQQAKLPAVTIAQDTEGQGSNCVLCTPASKMYFQYGVNSLQKHSVHAKEISASLQIISLAGAQCDIDTPADLIELVNHPLLIKTSQTKRYLDESGIAEFIRNIPAESLAPLSLCATVNYQQLD